MKIWNLLLISLTPFFLFAQNNLGSRLTAMGNNGAAIADIWAIQSNPSGITAIRSPAVSLNYLKHLFSDEITTQGLVAVIPFDKNFVGTSFQRYGFSEYFETKIGLAYAKKFGNRLSIAINANYHQLNINNYGTSNGFSVDVGALYQLDNEFTIGAFISNPSKQKFNAAFASAKIPTSFNIGLSYQASDKVILATSISKILNQTIDASVGVDYKMFNLLSLRGGLSVQPFKQYAGFGFNYRRFLMDMATVYDANLGYSPQITIGHAF